LSDTKTDETVVLGDFVRLDVALAGLVTFARVTVEAESVKGADDLVAGEHAFGERTVFMRTPVVDREKLSFACAENGNGTAIDIERTAEPDGKFFELAERNCNRSILHVRLLFFHDDMHKDPFDEDTGMTRMRH
jgi:hypothetical protein